MRSALAIGVVLGGLVLVHAQTPVTGSGALPDGWHVRFDDPAAAPKQMVVQQKEDAVTFTTGPSAIYYKSGMKASGDYELSAVVSQIKMTERPQEYGVFISGADLDKDAAHYTAFLVRQDGKYRIETHGAAGTNAIVDWATAAPMHEPSGMKTSNTLLIRVTGNDARFFIDGKQVRKLTRTEAGSDGIVGVRIGRDLHVQVTSLTLKKL